MRIMEITDEKILFDNGVIIIFYHDQDCCESVYADFKMLEDTDIKEKDIDKIEIELVKGAGFRLNGEFVPCYNAQNGYYSDDLELIIDYQNGKKEIYDLNECKKDDIC